MVEVTFHLGEGLALEVTKRLVDDSDDTSLAIYDCQIYRPADVTGNDAHSESGGDGSADNGAVIEFDPNVR